MDRLQFIGSINHGDFVSSKDEIIQFFDHIMAAYNLVGQINDIDVVTNVNSPYSITFTILFGNRDQAKCMSDRITNDFHNKMSLYCKNFDIHQTLSENVLGIQILQLANVNMNIA